MDVLALLKLQMEWGADEALEPAPVNHLLSGNTPPPRPGTKIVGLAPFPRPVAATGMPVARAEALAAAATTLDELQSAIAGFDGCPLRNTATHLVFNDGNPAAPVMLLGDPPGPEDDRTGKPFAGPLGNLLDRMLNSIGLDRSQVLLAPLMPWRPPGDRPPSDLELATCLPFTRRHVALARPQFLLLLGNLPARALLGDTQRPGRRRTPPTWTEMACPHGEDTLPVMTMPSLAAIARDPAAREQAWAALRQLRRTLDRS
jgi:uracil-DNA glycosylase family 4